MLALLCMLAASVIVSANQKESRLSVVSPPELVEQIKKLNASKKGGVEDSIIECELANFGSVQYGTRIIGEAHVSNPYNACDKAEVSKNESEF